MEFLILKVGTTNRPSQYMGKSQSDVLKPLKIWDLEKYNWNLNGCFYGTNSSEDFGMVWIRLTYD